MNGIPPAGLITLTTDFGHEGPFVGVMKGVIWGRFPQARLVDLTHEILAHWPAEAGFWLARAHRYFPPGTVHVAVVDPGVGTSRSNLVVQADGHLFLAPDNGLLAPVVARAKEVLIVRMGAAELGRLGVHRPSATFHGRDMFAPVAAELAAGRVSARELGEVTDTLVPSWVEEPTVDPRSVAGVVITLDHFGNLITNIDAGPDRALPPAAGARRQPPLRPAAHLWRHPARGIPRAHQLLRGARDCPGGEQCRRGPGVEQGSPGHRPRPHRPALSPAAGLRSGYAQRFR